MFYCPSHRKSEISFRRRYDVTYALVPSGYDAFMCADVTAKSFSGCFVHWIGGSMFTFALSDVYNPLIYDSLHFTKVAIV